MHAKPSRVTPQFKYTESKLCTVLVQYRYRYYSGMCTLRVPVYEYRIVGRIARRTATRRGDDDPRADGNRAGRAPHWHAETNKR